MRTVLELMVDEERGIFAWRRHLPPAAPMLVVTALECEKAKVIDDLIANKTSATPPPPDVVLATEDQLNRIGALRGGGANGHGS